MKPVVRKLRRVSVRLRPGGLLLLRPGLLRHMGWTPDDKVLLQTDAGRAILFKKPSEREWRIARLCARLHPSQAAKSLGFVPPTYAGFRALKPSPWKAKTARARVTPVDGQDFAVLGSAPATVQSNSRRRFDDAIVRREGPSGIGGN